VLILAGMRARLRRLRETTQRLRRTDAGGQPPSPAPASEEPPPVDYFDIGDRLEIGRHSYGHPLVRWYPGDDESLRVRIGSYVAIADDVVMMIGGEHRPDWISTFPFRIRFEMPGAYEDGHPASKGDITIGNDVWIGRGARLLSGVSVGDGAVIGAYAVVGKDVRPYAVVAGNPAREIRRRFEDRQIEALQRIRWWDWDDRAVRDAVPDLTSDRIDDFIARHDPGA
jgi:acetyltransferase-like isoleucine patch superfamily enzyme